MSFKINEIVEWESQSKGYKSRKRGAVIKIIPINTSIKSIIKSMKVETGGDICSLDEIYNMNALHKCGDTRDHESYFVAVEGSSKLKTRKPKLYWPRVSMLRKVIQ